MIQTPPITSFDEYQRAAEDTAQYPNKGNELRYPAMGLAGEAAERMGVSPGTLRNWDRTGRLKAYRNPLNGYRLYRHSDLEALLLQIAKGNN